MAVTLPIVRARIRFNAKHFRPLCTLLIFLGVALTSHAQTTQGCRPVALRCEYLENPLGLDVAHPRFSWQIEDESRGATQTAYRLLVATRPDLLDEPTVDIWESGKVESDETIQIEYKGPALASRTRYYWTVRIWDSEGKPSPCAQAAWFETALLEPSEWKGQFIGYALPGSATPPDLSNARWIWYPEGEPRKSVPAATRYFQRTFVIQPGTKINTATLFVAADDFSAVWLNGNKVGDTDAWNRLTNFEVAESLVPGANRLAISARNRDEGPAALLAVLRIRFDDESTTQIATGDEWLSSAEEKTNWTAPSQSPDSSWKPARIAGPVGTQPWGIPSTDQGKTPAAYMRKQFTVSKPVERARLYATAKGAYRIHINGSRVGKDVLTPDWTDYRKRILYQTYDVTDMLRKGGNAIGCIVGDGWYSSPLGWAGERNCFGPYPNRLLLQLHIDYTDGLSTVVATDSTWKASTGPILYSEIYDGEFYDARLEHPGWNLPAFDVSDWQPVNVIEEPDVPLEAQRSPTIHVAEILHPIAITEPSPGVFVFDMGQNMVGYARLNLEGDRGTSVTMRFAEILEDDGHVYRENLRGARATDTYVVKGDGMEVFEPHFTYHGFRYIEIAGYPGKPSTDTVEGVVFHTAVSTTGDFQCSSELVNQIFKNTRWGLRGNLHSVPTDCPQRDERLGWMGDAQVIWRTACYDYDIAAFTEKWMCDVVDAQSPEGGFSDVSPRVIDNSDGAPAWGDAGIIVPWTAWRMYGDTRLLEDNWDAMEKWMAYIHEANPDFIWANRRNNDFGDWVPAGSTTPKDVIATAYWANDARLMSQMAATLGKNDRVRHYDEFYAAIRKAFIDHYVDKNGKVGNGSQTCQILALHAGLVPDDLLKAAATILHDDIAARDNHLSTGFLGTAWLMPVLSENNLNGTAYRLLLNDTYPSWGYMVRKGATTIWERWNGDTGDPGMNSFNHYAFGVVVEWLYRDVAGIDQSPGSAGFKEIVIHPRPGPGLTWARASFESVRGPVRSSWSLRDGHFSLDVEIPPNTHGTVFVPTSDPESIEESGRPPASPVERLAPQKESAVFRVPPGRYQFRARLNSDNVGL